MREEEKLSRLLGDIYDAALNPGQWQNVLTDIAKYTGGQAAGLLSKDSVSKIGTAYFHCGVDPDYMRRYAETYWKFDPMAGLLFFDVERIVSIPELVPIEEFYRGRFHREWTRPQGFVDAANAVLDKSVTSYAYVSIIRSEAAGMVDDEMRRRMRLVVPHIRRAVLIGRVIDLKTVEAATFADTFDSLSAGLFLIGAGGSIVHANAAGHALLAVGDVLKAANGHLLANNPQADRSLHEIFTAAEEGDAALGAKGIAVPLTASGGERYVAHALSLTSGARRRAGATYAAVAALFVHKAPLNAPSPPEAIAKSYNLTPTELRVLLAIVDVGGVPDVAKALGVSTETAKTHLGRLYKKIGVGRQADLVKLVAGFASPLA